MNTSPFIIRATATFLLLLFSISTVPKMYFHAVMVQHRDITECGYPDKAASHIDSDGFNCDIDQQVITSPFLANFQLLKLKPPPVVQLRDVEALVPLILSTAIFTESRGPPYA